MKTKKLMNVLEFLYPINYSEKWDNVGLLIGDERKDVKRVLTVLEITFDVIDEAIEKNIDMIICHHPILFKSINSLNYKDPLVRMYVKLIKNDISVYAMHTNVDVSPNGMSDWICDLLEINKKSVFIPTTNLKHFEIRIETTQDKLYDLLGMLRHLGVGQDKEFIENALLAPKIKYYSTVDKDTGQKDVLQVEASLSEDLKSKVIYELNKNNFTEFKIFEINSNQDKIGLGKVGFVKAQTLEDLALKLKDTYDLTFCRIVGNREQVIKKVAIVPGSGKEFIIDAKKQGCDTLITGDVSFHDAQLASASGISIIDPGHNIEIIFNDAMAQIINMFGEVEAIASEIDTEPFEVV